MIETQRPEIKEGDIVLARRLGPDEVLVRETDIVRTSDDGSFLPYQRVHGWRGEKASISLNKGEVYRLDPKGDLRLKIGSWDSSLSFNMTVEPVDPYAAHRARLKELGIE